MELLIFQQIYDPFEPNKYSQCIQIFEEAQIIPRKSRPGSECLQTISML